jgi:flagellar biosynthesis protein FlhB
VAEQGAGERTEEATPRRRQQARRKGTVARSQDLSNAFIILILIGALPPVLSSLGSKFINGFVGGMKHMPQELTPHTVSEYCWSVVQGPLVSFLPLAGLIVVCGLIVNFAQVGFVLSAESMTPNLNKLNPANGLKRIFGKQGLMDGAKALAKSVIFTWIAWSVIQAHWEELIALSWTHTAAALGTVGTILHQILMKIGIAWIAVAGFDYFFQRKQVDKQLRMTKQELKQEMKEMESSPELKMAQARRRRQLSKGRMMEAVKTADVVVTNPTHFSVAIKYDSGKMHAPQVVAKGQDLIALKIREIAKEHRVAIVPNPPLARQLYRQCEIGDFVPRELFQAVAEVLAHVYRTLKRVQS